MESLHDGNAVSIKSSVIWMLIDFRNFLLLVVKEIRLKLGKLFYRWKMQCLSVNSLSTIEMSFARLSEGSFL